MRAAIARRVLPALAATILGCWAAALYLPALRHEFVYDDLQYLSANPHLQGPIGPDTVRWAFTNFYAANWHPLTWCSHMLDLSFFGFAPRGHHLVNLVLHAVNAVLCLLVLHRLTGRLWTSAAAAALFALHPLRVESVAWAAERKDLLAAFFGLGALWCHRRHAGCGGRRWLVGTCVLQTLSLMSKPMLVTLPILLLFLDWWPLGRVRLAWGERERAAVREKVPMLMISLAAGIVAIAAQSAGEAVRSFVRYPLGERLGNAAVSLVRYLGMTAWPAGLAIPYPFPQGGHAPLAVIAAAITVAAATAAALHAARRRPAATVGWCWFLVALLPVIGIIQVGDQALADRYTYLPSLGLVLPLAWHAGDVARRSSHARALVSAAIMTILLLLSFATRRQVGHWRDGVSLFAHAVRVTRGNDVALNNLGTALVAAGRGAEAGPYFREALRLNPRLRAESYFRSAEFLAWQGRWDDAAEDYREALRIDSDHRNARRGLEQAIRNAARR